MLRGQPHNDRGLSCGEQENRTENTSMRRLYCTAGLGPTLGSRRGESGAPPLDVGLPRLLTRSLRPVLPCRSQASSQGFHGTTGLAFRPSRKSLTVTGQSGSRHAWLPISPNTLPPRCQSEVRSRLATKQERYHVCLAMSARPCLNECPRIDRCAHCHAEEA